MSEKPEVDARLSQMEKMAAIGRLVAGFTHEVRNPLAIILIQVELLNESTKDPELRAGLERIKQTTKRVEHLVKNLLSYSRASKATVGPVDLCALLDTTLELVLLEDRWKDFDITKDFDRQAPWSAGNVNSLMQVFLNLIVNALQAMEGRPKPKLRLEVRGGPKETVTVEIADNGPGIPPEIQAKIFEPFFTTKGKQGTGLGLSIVKDIVTTHGGAIELVSIPGAGARFKVSLPGQPPPAA